jgi:anthranilate phosphoribosyltransferase
MEMKEILNDLFEHKSLDRATAKNILGNLARGQYNHAEMAAFLTVYLMRSITVEELSGFRDAMLELCIRVDLSDFDVVDLCGTGGDGKNTFNISTLASFVVAGAGYAVAKHGNSSVSSVCGSSNVLEYFGYAFTNDASELKKSLERANICFLHAPLFHPAMKNVAPVRKELGVKTFFNMLGPMVNPAFPRKQMTGVFSLELARLYSYLFQEQEMDFAVVHALDGYDEVSLTGPFKLFTRETEQILRPSDMGMQSVDAADLSGGATVEETARIFIDVLKGAGTTAQEQVVVANAAVAIDSIDHGIDLAGAIDKATEALESGKAYEQFKRLVGS